MCDSSQLMTSQSVPSAWLRSAETRGTWRRRKRRMYLLWKLTKVGEDTPAVSHCSVIVFQQRFVCTFREKTNSPPLSLQWMEWLSRWTSLTVVWQRKRRRRSGWIHPRLLSQHLLWYQSFTDWSAIVSCPVVAQHLVLFIISVRQSYWLYWFFRIRRRELHHLKPKTQQYAGKSCKTYCIVENTFCMALLFATGST